jgi:carbon storage regulator
MLIINRRSGENIVLAENITVSVLSIAGNRVKIGITAPGDVHIVREELLQRNQAEATATLLSVPLSDSPHAAM